MYDEKLDLEAQIKEGLGNDAAAATARLADIQKILGETDALGTGDPLIDYWEEQMARGETPDLDMTLEDLRGRKKNTRRR